MGVRQFTQPSAGPIPNDFCFRRIHPRGRKAMPMTQARRAALAEWLTSLSKGQGRMQISATGEQEASEQAIEEGKGVPNRGHQQRCRTLTCGQRPLGPMGWLGQPASKHNVLGPQLPNGRWDASKGPRLAPGGQDPPKTCQWNVLGPLIPHWGWPMAVSGPETAQAWSRMVPKRPKTTKRSTNFRCGQYPPGPMGWISKLIFK